MCEVNSCCCVSLRQGCIIIGGITILVSLVQTLIFSWVLVETYQSYQSSLNYQSSVETNSSMDDSSSSTYSFDSPRCPFGFLAISGRYSNDSYEEEYQDDAQEAEEEEVVEFSDTSSSSSLPETSPTRSSSRISAQQASPLALELTLEEGGGGGGGGVVASTAASVPLATPPREASPQGVAAVGRRVQSSSLSSSVVPLLALPSSTSPSSSTNGTSALSAASSSAPIAVADSFESLYVSSSSLPATNRTRRPRVRCAAQGQGLLWALVVASALYTLVGILLIFAILYCVSWQLSIWFFYTVGYNLFTLIVALMDGNYTNPPDISSYVVCVIMTYCVSVVDSYYEKQLLHDERMDKSGPGRRRSSLVIVRSSPDTPTSIQPDYIPPTSYRVPAGQSLAPPPAHSLAPPPPAHMLAPPPQKLAHQAKLAPPPLKAPPPVSQAPLEPHRGGKENHHHHHHHHKYHNNL